MFYISLPFFYQNQKFNNFFKNYVSNNPDKLIKKFDIEYNYGAFPWSFWNGSMNVHNGPAILTPQIEQICNNILTPIRVDCSNIYIIENEYYDIHENVILDILANTGAVYEISNIDLMNYIINKNKHTNFIISNNSQLIHKFSEEILNVFTEQNNVDLVTVANIKDFNLINLNNKNKIEIPIGYCGNCSFEQQLYCSQTEQLNIYNFSSKSIYLKCNKEKQIKNYLKELEPYCKQGFSHFKIIPNSSNLKNFNIKIIMSFIKPEYVGDCLNEYLELVEK